MTAELERAGVMRQDMIVLSQFSLTLEGSDVSRSTISAYRGMEKPAVIVVAGFEMDDTTLACARACHHVCLHHRAYRHARGAAEREVRFPAQWIEDDEPLSGPREGFP